MQPSDIDAQEYNFFTVSGSLVECRLASSPDGQELELFGNRAGLLSLANVLFWLVANASRREFLSLGELPFMRLGDRLAVCLRLSDAVADGSHGVLRLQDRDRSLEWVITEEGLQQVALWVHRLVSRPGHEYDRLLVAEGSNCGVHVRMTDAADWSSRGLA
jgi:hypothetical protein